MKNSFLILIFLLSIFSKCEDKEEYQVSASGLKYKFIYKNPKGKALQKDDIVSLKLKYFNEKDSSLFNSDILPADFRVKISSSEKDGLIQDAIKMMKTGDSASFLIKAENFYLKTKKDSLPGFLNPDELLRFEIKILKIISEKQLEKEYEQLLLKKEAEEKQILKEFLYAENINAKPEPSGIYIIKLKNGKGKKAQKGKQVTINFIGKYINGKIFDSSLDKGKPLTFVLGNKYVIPAWNEAIEKMREGDKIMLIAPSETAYGKDGLKDYVPPFTTLIYEIKLIKVN